MSILTDHEHTRHLSAPWSRKAGMERQTNALYLRRAYSLELASGGEEALCRSLIPVLPGWQGKHKRRALFMIRPGLPRLFTFLLVNDLFFGGLA